MEQPKNVIPLSALNILILLITYYRWLLFGLWIYIPLQERLSRHCKEQR